MRRSEPNGGSDHSRSGASRDLRGPTGTRRGPGARRLRVGLEVLEGRQLLAGVGAEYPLPGPSAAPSGITAGVVTELSTPTPDSMTNFITFRVPGSSSVSVSGINDAGTVTGTAGAGGYVRDAAGDITTFTVPGLASTIATGINNAGTVVGYNTFGYGPGFLRDAAGNITTFQIPGITPGFLIGVVSPRINDTGTIAGLYSSVSNGPPHGFLRDAAGNITTFDAPGSSSTTVTAINNAGTVLGTSNSPSFPNYLRDAAGNFSPLSVPGSDSAAFDAINNAGTVAGTFVAGGLEHGFLRDAAGNFTTFDVPGATSPSSFPGAPAFSVTAINDLGMVAGTAFVAGGLPVQEVGFLRDAAGNVTTFTPLPGGSVGNVSLNNAGVLAGSVFANGAGFGFVGTPVAPAVPTQTQITAGPNPSLVGQPVSFTAVVTPGQGGVPPTGSVSFSIDGGAATIVPLSLVGGQMQATLTVATLSEGSHTVVASYGGSPGLDPSSGMQVVSVILPPTVISVQRFGFHADPTRIVLGFSTALDPIHAQDVHNYSIVGPGGQSIAVDSAAYSPVTNTVVLTPHGRLNLHLIYRLTVKGTGPGGVTDTFGFLLDGAGNGLSGSNFVTNITASNLVLGSQVPGGPARLAHLGGVLSKIEANQSKQLARLHHPSKTHKATQRRPAAASSASPKPIKIPAHHGRAPIKRPAAAR